MDDPKQTGERYEKSARDAKILNVSSTVYGKRSVKNYKTFLATYPPAGGVIRVVLVKEDHGWYAFFCTDPLASVPEILAAFADRATIEVYRADYHSRAGLYRLAA